MNGCTYNPNNLLDILLGKMQLKNDAALARMLEVAPPVISKIRHHRLQVGASLLIRMHDVTGMSIRDLRDLMGDRRTKYRLSDAAWTDEERVAKLGAATVASHDTQGAAPLTRCAAGRDGECGHAQCPQLRDNEPCTTGRHCPLDNWNED